MINILSVPDDLSTNFVIEWLNSIGRKYNRFDDADIIKIEFEISINDDSFFIKYPGLEIDNSKKNVFWFRRSSLDNILPSLVFLKDLELEKQIRMHNTYEIRETISLIYHLFKEDYWLSNPLHINLNKSNVLKFAATCGLHIPDTCVTNNLKTLKEFKNKHHNIIAKNISELIFLNLCKNDKTLGAYTAMVTDDHLKVLPENFIPCLFQEAINKEYEIRTFFIENKYFSMAIFSQEDEQTSVDFRRYNRKVANRVVPYKLPYDIEKNLSNLMKFLGLNSGSIDLIKAKNGNLVFLEVNPVGQFGMVSYPCNYYLEKEIAATLLKMEINAN